MSRTKYQNWSPIPIETSSSQFFFIHVRIFFSTSFSNVAHPRQLLVSSPLLPFLGPASLILPRDENPRCPPTDTNGHLCQRRNLLLYIPLYKQRVNRAAYEPAIGIRAVETDLSIVLCALLLLLLLLLPSCILLLFPRGRSLIRIYICIRYKLEYTPVPVPFHQTNFDRSDCSPVDFSFRSLFFFFPPRARILEFLEPRWTIGRLFLGEFKMESIKLIFS